MKGVAGSYYIIVSHDFMHNHLSFQVTLGYNRKKLEKKHWAEMIENPRRPIIHWHVLKVGGNIMMIFFTGTPQKV